MARYRKEDDNNSLIIAVTPDGRRFIVDEYGDYYEIQDDHGIPQYTAKTDTQYGCVECGRYLRNLTRMLYDDVVNGCAYNGKRVTVK